MWTRRDYYLDHGYTLAEVSLKVYVWCDVKCGLLISALLHYICNFSVSFLLPIVLWTMLCCTLELCQKILMTAEFSLLAFRNNWVICLDAALYLLICVVCCTTSQRLPMKILNSVLVENWEGGMMLTAACWHEGSKIRKTIQMTYGNFLVWKEVLFACEMWNCITWILMICIVSHCTSCYSKDMTVYVVRWHNTLCLLSNETAFIMKTQMNILGSFYGRLLI
jgi:hypothetical protein